MSQMPVLKFLFRSEWKVLNEALTLKSPYEFKSCENAEEVIKNLTPESAGLVVASLKDKNDLIQIATLVKLTKKAAANSLIKIVVINFSQDKQFEKAISRLGVSDLLEQTINSKGLRFKVDFHMRSLAVQIRNQPQVNTASSSQAKEAGKTAEKKVADNVPVWVPGLDCEDDIWILRNDQDCKKVLTRWLVKYMGPSPYVAQWADSGTPGVWRFDFKEDNNEFVYGKGAWFFRGEQKPEFIWSENNWLFTGSSFELFYKEGDAIYQRVKLKDKVLTIAKNSDFGKTKLQKVMESFNKELVFKRDQVAKGEDESIEQDQELYKNLSGKGKTDTLDHGPLSGKGSTDALDHGPLSGEGSTDNLKGGPLSGKGKTSNTTNNPLSMDLDLGENDLSTDPFDLKATKSFQGPSFWDGKPDEKKKQKEDGSWDAPAPEAYNEGQELGLDAGGKVSTYYKNHNESEQFEAKDIGHNLKKDGVAKDLQGKIDPAKNPKDQQGDLSGGSATDRLKSHLTNPNGEKEKKEAEKTPPKGYSGKSGTDKMPGHLSSPNRDKPEGVAPERALPEARNSGPEVKPSPQADLKGVKSGPSAKLPNKSLNTSGDEARDENVLPFVDKNSTFDAEEELPKDLEEAIQTAKVESFMMQGTLKVGCKLDDYFDSSIIFSTSEPGIISGRPVKLSLIFNYMSKDTILKFEGQVVSSEADEEGTNFVTVEINEENNTVFSSFMKLYQSRQKNVNLFMKVAKGY